MQPSEIRGQSPAEIARKLDEAYQELFNLRFQNAIGQLQNTSRIKAVKKTIARVLTVVREKQMAGEQSAGRR